MKKQHFHQTVLQACMLIVSLILSGPRSFAVVTTQDIESSFKGYSIEKIPGADEFVAAGTFYVDGLLQPYTGYHFLHLDINGNVLLSNYVFPDPLGASSANWQLRVVDITVEDADNYWIVMAARDYLNNYDFIYAEKVSISSGGTISPVTPNHAIVGTTMSADFPNVYPTHSVFNNGHLYICGYRSSLPPAVNAPTTLSLYKQGLMVSINANPQPSAQAPVVAMQTWETVPSLQTFHFDYDMALKIRNYGDQMYVTGAGNVPNSDRSGAIFIHFSGPQLNVVMTPSVSHFNPGIFYPNPTPHGIFGIDVMQKNGNIYLLTTEFEYGNISRWGVARLDPATYLPDPALPSYASRNTTNTDWVKQFLPDPLDPDNVPLNIVGEIVQEYANCQTPVQYVPPTFSGVNPFIIFCNLWWDPIMGSPTAGINFQVTSQYIHPANTPNSTTSNHLGYLQTTASVSGTCLENVTRLHTFACRYPVENTDGGRIALIYPKQHPTNPDFLNAKFMTLNVYGQEEDCHNEWTCNESSSKIMLLDHTFNVHPEINTHHPVRKLKRRVINVSHDNCQNGAYKPTNISSASNIGKIEIYPNPATTELNIALPAVLSNDDAFSLNLTDMTGKTVLQLNEIQTGQQTITVTLPALSSGMYISVITLNGTKHTAKIIVQ